VARKSRSIACWQPALTCPRSPAKASIAKLAQRTGWERPTVKKALHNLIAMGAVEQGDRDPGGAYTWILPHRHRSKPKKRGAA